MHRYIVIPVCFNTVHTGIFDNSYTVHSGIFDNSLYGLPYGSISSTFCVETVGKLLYDSTILHDTIAAVLRQYYETYVHTNKSISLRWDDPFLRASSTGTYTIQ